MTKIILRCSRKANSKDGYERKTGRKKNEDAKRKLNERKRRLAKNKAKDMKDGRDRRETKVKDEYRTMPIGRGREGETERERSEMEREKQHPLT